MAGRAGAGGTAFAATVRAISGIGAAHRRSMAADVAQLEAKLAREEAACEAIRVALAEARLRAAN